MKKIISTALAAVAALSLAGCSKKDAGDTVKVGILHSLSGTMSISEISVRDAEILAINEINAAGGGMIKLLQFLAAGLLPAVKL